MAEAGLSWGDALECSFEQLELILAAARRRTARRTLMLAGAIGAAMSGADAWRKAAAVLRDESMTGLG